MQVLFYCVVWLDFDRLLRGMWCCERLLLRRKNVADFGHFLSCDAGRTCRMFQYRGQQSKIVALRAGAFYLLSRGEMLMRGIINRE